MAFMGRWMSSHYTDAKTVLKKPLVIAEFGKSNKDPGFSLNARNLYMDAVYRNIYKYARNGGTLSGGLVWQLMAQGMQPFDDGYEIVLQENPSTSMVISRQSHAMTTLSHLFSTTQNHHPLNQAQRKISHDHHFGHGKSLGHHFGHGKKHGQGRKSSP